MQKQNFPAFTLIELIVVVAIILLILTLTLQSSFGSAAQITFLNSSDKVLDLFRQARSLAITGKAQLDYMNFDNDDCGWQKIVNLCAEADYVTPAGYGVHLKKGATQDSIFLFADNHGEVEGTYDPAAGPNQYTTGKDIILETFYLPKGLKIGFMDPDINQATIIYTPIFADVIFGPLEIAFNNQFEFRVYETDSNVNRVRCYKIHKISGIPEPC